MITADYLEKGPTLKRPIGSSDEKVLFKNQRISYLVAIP